MTRNTADSILVGSHFVSSLQSCFLKPLFLNAFSQDAQANILDSPRVRAIHECSHEPKMHLQNLLHLFVAVCRKLIKSERAHRRLIGSIEALCVNLKIWVGYGYGRRLSKAQCTTRMTSSLSPCWRRMTVFILSQSPAEQIHQTSNPEGFSFACFNTVMITF